MELTGLNIFPIKSTRRVVLERAKVNALGLADDRRYMLVDVEGKFITAREVPELLRIGARVTDDGLLVSAPGVADLRVHRPANDVPPGERVRIWRSVLDVVPVGAESDAWFSSVLGLPCKLVWLPDSQVRETNPAYSRPGDRVAFADGYPLLVISRASLDALNARLQQPVPMTRFRPNLVVGGTDAFAEDTWRRIRIGGIEFESAKACSRCVLTTIDPETAEKNPRLEPLRTLSQFRRLGEQGVYFGQNLIPRGEGELCIGDTVDVMETGAPKYA